MVLKLWILACLGARFSYIKKNPFIDALTVDTTLSLTSAWIKFDSISRGIMQDSPNYPSLNKKSKTKKCATDPMSTFPVGYFVKPCCEMSSLFCSTVSAPWQHADGLSSRFGLDSETGASEERTTGSPRAGRREEQCTDDEKNIFVGLLFYST